MSQRGECPLATPSVANIGSDFMKRSSGGMVELCLVTVNLRFGSWHTARATPNEKEISHGRVSWQTHWTYFEMEHVGSSIGEMSLRVASACARHFASFTPKMR